MSLLLMVTLGWAVVATLSLVDRRLLGSWVTPFVILAIPQMCVITAAGFADRLGFVPLGAAAAGILTLGLVVFWLGALGINLGALGTASGDDGTRLAMSELKWRKAVTALSWVLLIVMVVGFWRALRGINVIGEIVQESFQRRFEQGLSGLARPVAMLLTVYWIGSSERLSWWHRVTLAGLIIMLFASFVKGTLLLPLIGGLLYRMLGGRGRLRPRRVLAFGALGLAVLVVGYLVQARVWGVPVLGNWMLYVEIGRRTLSYVLAGVLGFSRAWKLGMPVSQGEWPIIVAPIWNLYARLTGIPRVPNLSPHYVVIDLRSQLAAAESNVRTLFGTLIQFLGVPGAIAAMFVLGSLVAWLFAVARRSGNCWLLASLGLISAALFFGWFDYYFALAFWYIAIPVGLLLAAVGAWLDVPWLRSSRWTRPGTSVAVSARSLNR